MMTRLKLCWLLIPALLLSVQLSKAQPVGTYEFEIAGDEIPVFDLTGNYDVEVPIGTPGLVSGFFGFTMVQNAKGGLNGAGLTVLSVNGFPVAANYVVTGKVKRSRGLTRATFRILLTGIGTIAEQETTFKVTVLYDVNIDELGVFGEVRTKANFSGFGSGKAVGFIPDEFELFLPDGIDGSWLLTLEILPFGNRLAGTAFITFPTGREFLLDLSGKYNPFTDVAEVKINGIGDSLGTKVKASFVAETGELILMSGKVLGQKVSF